MYITVYLKFSISCSDQGAGYTLEKKIGIQSYMYVPFRKHELKWTQNKVIGRYRSGRF